jgi:Ca2+-binding EF-hand superfamily protein
MDSPESLMAMKSVFKRLCTCSKELISVSDVIKVHSLLGEPVDEAEEKHMTTFFKTSDKAQKSITFEMFMDWWSNLHDSSADPDQYYSSERYRQRFKVLQSRLKDPKIANISTITEGDPSSRRFRVFF